MPDITTQEAVFIEFPYHPGRAPVTLLTSGPFAKYRNIRCHCGGTLPTLARRMRDKVARMPPDRVTVFAPNGIDAEFRRQFYETADAAYAPPMAALLDYYVEIDRMPNFSAQVRRRNFRFEGPDRLTLDAVPPPDGMAALTVPGSA